jgi:hypothetical protein
MMGGWENKTEKHGETPPPLESQSSVTVFYWFSPSGAPAQLSMRHAGVRVKNWKHAVCAQAC